MDQHKEEQKEEHHSKESTDQHKEEEKKEGEEQDNSEESMDRRTEEKNSQGLVDERKTEAEAEERSSDDSEEAAMAAWSLFAHPWSLLQYVIRGWACRLGLHDSFGDLKPSAAPAAPADSSSTQGGEEDTKTTTGFYIQEVITRVRAVRIRPQPPNINPREGSGGNGGQHH